MSSAAGLSKYQPLARGHMVPFLVCSEWNGAFFFLRRNWRKLDPNIIWLCICFELFVDINISQRSWDVNWLKKKNTTDGTQIQLNMLMFSPYCRKKGNLNLGFYRYWSHIHPHLCAKINKKKSQTLFFWLHVVFYYCKYTVDTQNYLKNKTMLASKSKTVYCTWLYCEV